MINLLLILISCTTDVGIISVDKQQNDSAISDTYQEIETGLDQETDLQSEEPSGTVGLVEWELEQIACQQCMGVSQEITVEFKADFHEKINESHPTWIPNQGQCVQSLNYFSIARNSIDMGPSLNIQGSFSGFQAYKSYDNIYSTFIAESQYERDAMYTVYNSNGDSFSFLSLHGFDYIEPMELRYVDPSYAFAAPIYRTGSTFWWGPSGTNDLFNITLAVYSNNGSSLLGYVSCTEGDSGMMTIPGQYLGAFPAWSLVAVHMTRFKNQRVLFEKLNGYVDVHLYWSVVGTGHIE
jgi:hypothetical protein